MIPLLFALFYPNIGTILSYVGAFAGFLIIYCIPVLVYLKKLRTETEQSIQIHESLLTPLN